MALKKGVFENYVIQKATPIKQKPLNDKYSNNKVFDDPVINKKNLELHIETVNKPETNCKQTVNKPETNCKQTVNKPPETVNKVYTKLETNRKQIVSNSLDKNNISMIFGLQRSIILIMHKNCIENKQETTTPLTLEYIANCCKTTTKTVKTTIQRLVKTNLIKRIQSQNGRGGWTIYELESTLFRSILHEEKIHSISIETVNKVYTKPETTSYTSSSSNTTTTTTKLSEKWEKINFELLQDFGFSKEHVLQISKLGSITPDELQNSIDYFVFDLRENNKAKEIKKSPLSFFMGIMRGHGFYNAPKNYESQQDRKLRLKIEQEKREKENREKLEKELINIEYDKWHSKLTDAEIDSLVPEKIKNSKYTKEPLTREFLKSYFIKNFWDTIKQEKHTDCF